MSDRISPHQSKIAKKCKHDEAATCTLASLVLLSALAVLPPQDAVAAKDDFVWLVNGDRITCDIKALERGRLRVSADSTGTVQLDWDDVVRMTSSDEYIIEPAGGERFTGSLIDSEPDGQIRVPLGSEEVLLNMTDVVWIDPVQQGTLTDRWDGNIRAGLDYTKANNSSTFNGDFNAHRRSKDFQIGISAIVLLRSQDGTAGIRRGDDAVFQPDRLGASTREPVVFLRRELMSDVFLELRLFGSYDNERLRKAAKVATA